MSEFTNGLLVLKTHIASVQIALTDLDHPSIVKHLNERWSTIVFEDTHPEHQPIHSWILKTSQDIPLLYFHNAEDHGWGYQLFYQGAEKASLDVSYAIAEGRAVELAKQLYPGVDFYDFHGGLSIEKRDLLYKQVTDSKDYLDQIASQYAKINLDALAVLGVSLKAIAELRDILRPARYEGRVDGFSQVEAFQKVLGLEEMSWVSYHILNRPDNTGDFDD